MPCGVSALPYLAVCLPSHASAYFPIATLIDPLSVSTGGKEVVINRFAGEAVLRGAQVYSPGLLAASRGLAAGDLVGVSVACELPGSRWCGIARGAIIPPPSSLDSSGRGGNVTSQLNSNVGKGMLGSGVPTSGLTRLPHPGGLTSIPLPSRSNLFLGVGRCVEGRRGMFRNQSGMAVEMVQRVYNSPSINGDSVS